jgi:hypothetical protein
MPGGKKKKKLSNLRLKRNWRKFRKSLKEK